MAYCLGRFFHTDTEQWTPELNYTKKTKQQQARREKAGVTVHAARMDIQLFIGGLLSPADLGVKYLDIAVTSPFTKACLDPAPAHKRGVPREP